MKIFIDFDDVIFNAKRFKEDFIKVFQNNGVTRAEFENSYYTYSKRAQEWGKYYDPKNQIRVLRRRNQIDHEKLEKDLDLFLADLREYVFPDVYRFLESFPKKDLFLLTYGHVKFQKIKIKGAGVKKYFKKLLISKDNKINVIMETCKAYKFSPGEKIILIDDRPEQLERAERARKSVVTFHMCRPEGRYTNLICLDKDYEVNSLKETLGIIKGNNIK